MTGNVLSTMKYTEYIWKCIFFKFVGMMGFSELPLSQNPFGWGEVMAKNTMIHPEVGAYHKISWWRLKILL